MHFSQDEVYNIIKIKCELPSQVSKHILVLHAASGCDTVSAIYGIGKSTAFKVFDCDIDLYFLNKFQEEHASNDDIKVAGESLLLHFFKSKKCKSLDRLRYLSYMKKIAKKSLTSNFELESLPPTSGAAKYHSFRVYLTVQPWLGVIRDACLWGWKKHEGKLLPTLMDTPIAPDSILKIISCGCKTACGNRCKCRKAGLYCTPMCTSCNGQTCTNTEMVPDEETSTSSP